MMNTQDRIALVIGRLMIEREVSTEQLEQAAKKIAELEAKDD